MSGLPDDYFVYPLRKRGMDHDRHPFRALPDAKPVAWPNGARVALWIVVPMGHFPMDAPAKPFVAVGGMERPYPSYWDYTQRDYGNRIGVYRLLRALTARKLRATAMMSAVLAQRYPVLMDDIAAAQWEVACAGLDMGRLHHGGVPEDQERAMVRDAAAMLRARFGPAVRGWHSPAHSESARTLDLVAEAGFDYATGWVNDEMPYAHATTSGALTAMPLPVDLSDQRMLYQQHMATEDYCAAILAAHDALDAEAKASGSGRILTVTATPWLMGLPHRIRAFGAMLDTLLARGSIWPATGAEIVDCWRQQG